MKANVTRRNFLTSAALVGAGFMGASLSACAPKSNQTAEQNSANANIQSEEIPQTDKTITSDMISRTIDCEVAVVGLGLAGICATRAAAEEGVKVVAIEKCPTPSVRSSQFSVFNTDNARAMGIEDIDTADLTNEIMIQTGHHSDFRIVKTWADHCGEVFDWYASAYDGLVWLHPGEEAPTDEKQVYVGNNNIYTPYKYGRDHEKIFTGTLSIRPNGHEPVTLANLDMAMDTGNVETFYDSPARQLVTNESGAVTGVIFEDYNDGSFTQVNASKGVILATGGYSHNDEMMQHYLPWFFENRDQYLFTYGHFDATGEIADQGDGHRMATSIGARMENGPHCAMSHGDLGALGVDAFLQLNGKGERYINEDITNDHFGTNFVRQPGNIVYQIFDANWADQLPFMQGGLGSYQNAESIIASRGPIEDWVASSGSTIDEMIEGLDVETEVAEKMKAEIERYNELANAGYDADFGKSAERLFPIETSPFYCITYSTESSGGEHDSLRLLVTMSGLTTNTNAQVFDNEWNIIPGLYAIGNVQGGRFGGDYPTTIAGASHSMAMTYGYLAGKHIALS